jgi:two-component system sensor histidine kinase YesM
VDGITTLGNMLRSIYTERSLMMPLNDEIEYIENYLKIMNARYGEGVNVSIVIPNELLSYKIIRFILQPIVENAFVHGISSKNYLGTITIAAYQSEDIIVIIVSDNGAGIHEDRLTAIREYIISGDSLTHLSTKGSIGLANVNRRIQLQYGAAYGLTINSNVDAGTDVIIRVPAAQ